MSERLQSQTVEDFGEQWTAFRDNEGFYGSLELFRDIFDPLLRPEELKGCRVAEVGSGAGRIVNMLLDAGAEQVIAVEPSDAVEVLRENTKERAGRVTVLKATGQELPPSGDLDYVFCVGVLHHIPDPAPTVQAALGALRPGGRIAAWVYGKEGNRLYLALVLPLRAVAKRLPHRLLSAVVRALDVPLALYIRLCKALPLPLRAYMRSVLGRLTPQKRRLVVYDQLNPAYARYYTRRAALDLIQDAGFEDVVIHHRHGYSWTVLGTKPAEAPASREGRPAD